MTSKFMKSKYIVGLNNLLLIFMEKNTKHLLNQLCNLCNIVFIFFLVTVEKVEENNPS